MRTVVLAADVMSVADRIGYAARMLLIGMGTIFAALTILWGALVLFRLAVEHFGKAKKQAAPAPALPEKPVEAVADDGALIAAITAAVAAAMSEENGGQAPAFRVVSFSRVKTAKRG